MDICKAIQERKLVNFLYEGLERVVMPAAHGSHASTGNLSLRGYQTDGRSSSGNLPGWKMFTVSKISNFRILDDKFAENPPEYKRGDSDISPLHCEL